MTLKELQPQLLALTSVDLRILSFKTNYNSRQPINQAYTR